MDGKRTLEEIRDLLGDLPQRMGDVLRGHEQGRYGGGGDEEEESPGGGIGGLFGGARHRRRGTATAESLKNMASTLGGVTHGIGRMFGQNWGDAKGFDWFKKAAAEAFGEGPRRPQPIPNVLPATPAAQAVHKVWIDGPLPLPVSLQGASNAGGALPGGPLALPRPPLITPPPASPAIRALPPPTALSLPPPRATTVTTLSGSPLSLGSTTQMPAWLQTKLQPSGHSAAPGTTRISAPSLLWPPPITRPAEPLRLPAPPGRALSFYASSNPLAAPRPERVTQIIGPAQERLRRPAPATALAPPLPPRLQLPDLRPLAEDSPKAKVDFFHGPPQMPERLSKVYSHQENLLSAARQQMPSGNIGRGDNLNIVKELIEELRGLREELQRSNRHGGQHGGGQATQEGPRRPTVFIGGQQQRDGTQTHAVPKAASSHFAQGPWAAAVAAVKATGK